MPWKVSNPMDQRLQFILDHARGRYHFSALCELYGISRKTGYKWLDRFRAGGWSGGVNEHSRARPQQPRITEAMQQAILQLRAAEGHGLNGPKKILAGLATEFPGEALPCRTTIYRYLKQAGLVLPGRRVKRVALYPSPLAGCSEPNGLWSVDYKGQFRLGNGEYCYPLTVMDHASRALRACKALRGTTYRQARQAFEDIFMEHGLPDRIRSDNGVPFAGKGVAGLSTLSIWWLELGIMPERIQPGKPQQNGRHERMHRSLKLAVCGKPAGDLASQQVKFDEWVDYYNNRRVHEALQQRTPASQDRPSGRRYTGTPAEMQYPAMRKPHRVKSGGLIYVKSNIVYVGALLAGKTVGVEEIGDGLWRIFFGRLALGAVDERQAKNGYLTLKVSPM